MSLLLLALLSACDKSGGVDLADDTDLAPAPTDDTQPPGDTSPPKDTEPPADTEDTAPPEDTEPPDTDDPPAETRGVVLMIGDGMGPGQLEAASLYAYGKTGRLFLESLPSRGSLRTASLSGVTDSAASATAMATGVKTFNERVGVDRDGADLETLVELAKSLGMATAVVSTASVPHATPAAFTSHRDNRNDYVDIADDQALEVRPDVLLGGGAQYYLPAGSDSMRMDGGLIEPLEDAGCAVVYTADELADAPREAGTCLYGLFARDHMEYTLLRPSDTTEPTLTEMSLAALEIVSKDPDGFFLMIEGARIDMASHGNDLENTVHEAVAFDEAVAAVAARLGDQQTLLVTADHECGGLEVTGDNGAGALPDATWRWGQHTNALVDVFAQGPGGAYIDGELLDHTWVHAAIVAELSGEALAAPAGVLTPDGSLEDHRWRAAEQSLTTDFGAGFNQLDALTLDADAGGLFLGVEGVFEWQNNAVIALVDVDYGAGTGAGALTDLADPKGQLDGLLSAVTLGAPAAAGFGADVVLGVWGGQEVILEDLRDGGGLRGLTDPYGGELTNLAWLPATATFGQDVRADAAAISPVSGEGLELAVPWTVLYPDLAGGVPPGATVAAAVVLVNSSGTTLSNQALPPYASEGDAALSGVVTFTVDSDKDGVGDGDSEPALVE
jgi:alkaline phosphatase